MNIDTPFVVYSKLVNGDHIDDESLIQGILFFQDLADKLIQCGPVFRLAYREAANSYRTLRDYAGARDLNIPKGITP